MKKNEIQYLNIMLECNFKLFSRVCFACIYNLLLENVQDCHSLSWHVLRSPIFIQCPVFGGSPIYMYVYSWNILYLVGYIACILWGIHVSTRVGVYYNFEIGI